MKWLAPHPRMGTGASEASHVTEGLELLVPPLTSGEERGAGD